MGVRTTFGMGWWDPDAMVKIYARAQTPHLTDLATSDQPVTKESIHK